MPESDYNYLYGLIRSRESELIDSARLRALVGMQAVAELVQIYPDCPFLRTFAPDLDEAALERAIGAEQEDLRVLIERYAPEPALRELLLVPRDLYNLKVALRMDAQRSAADGADAIAAADEAACYGPPGTRSVAAIRAAVAGEGTALTSAGDTDRASRALARILERALAAFYAASRNGQVLELAVDRLVHLFQATTAAEMAPEVGAAYADHGAIAAGELLARGRAAGLPWEVVRWGLLELPGQTDLEELYAAAPAEWGGRLASFSGVLRALLTDIAEGAEIGTAVRLQQEQVDRRIAAWRMAPPSFAFAVYYLRKKRADLDALRLICLAKLKGVAEATIDARVGGPFMGQAQAVLAA